MKRIILSTLMIFAMTLTACSPLSTASPNGATQTSDELPIGLQLAVGTLKLENTENDITADQAEELMMYWQVYEEVSQSDTAAQEEIDAVIAQIQETMTTKQMQAISDMQISQQDVIAAMQGPTVTTSASQNGSNSGVTVSDGGNVAGAPPDGGGAPPDGGGMPADFGGTGSTANANQTQNAQASSSTASSAGVPFALVEAVIQVLQQKIPS